MTKKKGSSNYGDGFINVYESKNSKGELNGKWTYRLSVPVEGQKKPVEKMKTTCKTEAQAWREAEELRDRIKRQNITNVKTNKIILNDLAKEWLTKRKSRKAIATYNNDFRYLKTYVLPALGEETVQSLNFKVLDDFVSDICSLKNLGGFSKVLIYQKLKLLLDYAVENEIILTNPIKRVEKPKHKKNYSIEEVFTQEEVEKILSANRNSLYYLAYVLGFIAGLRKGEIFGIRWQDVDLTNGVISLKNQVTPDGQLLLNDLKTDSSARDVMITPKIKNAIEEHMEKMKKRNLFENKHGLVFLTCHGNPVCTNNFWITFQKACLRAGAKPRKIHDMRKTFATQLVEDGADIKTLQDSLGHASVNTSLIVYAKVNNETKKNILGKLSSRYEKTV